MRTELRAETTGALISLKRFGSETEPLFYRTWIFWGLVGGSSGRRIVALFLKPETTSPPPPHSSSPTWCCWKESPVSFSCASFILDTTENKQKATYSELIIKSFRSCVFLWSVDVVFLQAAWGSFKKGFLWTLAASSTLLLLEVNHF